MADLRKAIMEAVLEADRLHERFSTKSLADKGTGRIDVFGMLMAAEIPLLFRPLSGLLGVYMPRPGPGILVTTRRQLPIQRFTAAHELGHAVMHHTTSLDDEDLLARLAFDEAATYDVQEVQANAFASELLMPKWLLAKHLIRQGWAADAMREPVTVYQLSLRLGTSYAATCHALLRHRAIDHRVHRSLLGVQPKAIKQRLTEGYEPANWFGDVWVVTERDDGLFLEGSRSDVMVVKLREHSGSGYLWQLDDIAKAGLAVVQDEVAADQDPEAVGGVVSRTVVVKGDVGARCQLLLEETRPWQRDGEPLHSVALSVDLSGPVAPGLLPPQQRAFLGAA